MMVFMNVIKLFIAFTCVNLVGSFKWKIPVGFGGLFGNRPVLATGIPSVKKPTANPVLVIEDVTSKCNIHLVGVSHGSPSSAALVKQTIDEIKPAVIVLELCSERYLSICLEAGIRPRGNATLATAYDSKSEALRKMREKRKESSFPSSFFSPLFSNVRAYANFLKAQGLLVGSFMSLGLFVSGLQRLYRSPTGDEFVTAMAAAEEQKICIRMGDARQSDTLKSIEKLVTMDTIRPREIIKGAKTLVFSAFGIPDSDKSFSSGVSEARRSSIKKSQWISIPLAYAQNASLLKSLFPIFAISAISTFLTILPAGISEATMTSAASSLVDGSAAGGAGDAGAVAAVTDLASASTSVSLSATTATTATTATAATAAGSLGAYVDSVSSWISSILYAELPPQAEFVSSSIVDVMSLLLLIRLSKIIGSDRDRVIASKIKDACREFQGQNVVVVIGMLHCNGVAKWILSGHDPLKHPN